MEGSCVIAAAVYPVLAEIENKIMQNHFK